MKHVEPSTIEAQQNWPLVSLDGQSSYRSEIMQSISRFSPQDCLVSARLSCLTLCPASKFCVAGKNFFVNSRKGLLAI